MTNAGWIPLSDLPKGAVFETKDGVRAVKSEYYHSILFRVTSKGATVTYRLDRWD